MKQTHTILGIIIGLGCLCLVVGVSTLSILHITHKDSAGYSNNVLGEKIGNASYTMQVLAVNTPSNDAQPITKRISVTVEITNHSNQVLQLSPGLQFNLVGKDSVPYNVTAKYLDPTVTLGGPVQPNEKWNGTLDFEIPTTTDPQTLVFHADGSAEPLRSNL